MRPSGPPYLVLAPLALLLLAGSCKTQSQSDGERLVAGTSWLAGTRGYAAMAAPAQMLPPPPP